MTRKDLAATFCRAFGCFRLLQALFVIPQIFSVFVGQNSIPLRYVLLPSIIACAVGIVLIVFSKGIAVEMTGELEPALEKPVDSPHDLSLLGQSFFGLLLLDFGISQVFWHVVDIFNGQIGNWRNVLAIGFVLQTLIPLILAAAGFFLAFRGGISARLRPAPSDFLR